MDDDALLREYAQRRSQDAFRELVDRHLGMVYSAAQRMVRDTHLAEEIAQTTFNTLAQKAGSIRPPQIVGGWLYNTTRNLAMHAVRSEQRRREREQTAVVMQALHTHPDTARILEHLEPAMAELDADDRDAIVLRYLEDRSLREVGAELGISEDAARMRVNRALERLRGVFGREGVTVTSVALAAAISAGTGTATAFPSGLGATIAAGALAGTAAILTPTTITTMNWLNLKSATAIVSAAIVAGTSAYLVQNKQIKTLTAENQDLVTQQQKLRTDEEAALAAARARNDELERLRKDVADLARLRSEVTQLRQQHEADLRAMQQAAQARAADTKNPSPNASAGYVPKDKLANVGYSSPEAAVQTTMWAAITGKFDQALASLPPDIASKGPDSPQMQEQLEKYKIMNTWDVKGLRMAARKVLADGTVEIKLKVDLGPTPGFPPEGMPYLIQPMVKVGNEWRISPQERMYDPNWDSDGRAQPIGQ